MGRRHLRHTAVHCHRPFSFRPHSPRHPSPACLCLIIPSFKQVLTWQLLTWPLLSWQVVLHEQRGAAAVDSPALPEVEEPPAAAAATAALAGLRPALRERLLPSEWASATVRGAAHSLVIFLMKAS